MSISLIKKVYVDRLVENSKSALKILEKLKGLPVEVVESPEPIKKELRFSPDPVGEGKQILYLTKQKSFSRPCPCTPGCLGCGYWTIDLDLNCPLDCSYCILQKYLEGQPLTVALNREDLKRELEVFFEQKKTGVWRIGTGELADSLALDELTENSVFLIEVFRDRPQFLLELKSKATYLELLLSLKPPTNVILAWSLNSPAIIKSEERRTASLEDRLEAAGRAVAHGYKVAFHFDPIVYYEDWVNDY
ncbi:MAG: SPL family radical SAM protein, partial [Candidatus Saccharicenans sp.]